MVSFNYHIEKVIGLRPGEINLSGRIEPLQYSGRETDTNIVIHLLTSFNVQCPEQMFVFLKINYVYLKVKMKVM